MAEFKDLYTNFTIYLSAYPIVSAINYLAINVKRRDVSAQNAETLQN